MSIIVLDKYDVESCQDIEARNKMNLNFTLNLEENDLTIDQSSGRVFKTKKVLSRQPSLIINRTDTGDEDTFENILQVTTHHEAIMAYYYMDENNKVRMVLFFFKTPSKLFHFTG